MMTVGELKEYLEQFEDDTPVVIGMIQRYGSNWANEIIAEEDVCMVNFLENKKEQCVVLTQGRQIGTVKYEEE